jgi:hypothetical protein
MTVTISRPGPTIHGSIGGAAMPGPLKEAAHWTEWYRHIWQGRLDRLDKYLRHVQAKEEKSHDRKQRRKQRQL